MRGIF
jgi:hypothetical protein